MKLRLKSKPKPDLKTIEELKIIVLGGENPYREKKSTYIRSFKKPQSESLELGHRINTNQKREIIQKSSETFKTRTAFLKRI
jgi:hypothetical protein